MYILDYMNNKQQPKETMQKYKIGILKYTNEFVKTYKKNLTNIMRYSFINVEATDPTEAIQMHNEVFDNYKDVKEYLIIPRKNKS